MAEQRTKARGKTRLKATSRQKRRAANRVVVEILGNNDVKTERVVWINAEDYISLKAGEEIVWKNPNKVPYAVTFKANNCPLNHQHEQQRCQIMVPANSATRGIVHGEEGQRFYFEVLLADPDSDRGTPRIIIQGKAAADASRVTYRVARTNRKYGSP